MPAGSDQPAPLDQEITIASGLNDPAGVAVDTAGDVFIAERDYYGGKGDVLKVSPQGQTTTIGAFGVAMGVALDAAGNLYVSDQTDGVVEVPADGSPQITVINPGNNQAGLAVAAPPPTFTADTAPDLAPLGQAYSYTYTATVSNGEPAPTFALASGTLPPGLTLDPSTGVLSGAVSATGTWQFVVEAENAVTASIGPVTTITNAVPAVSTVSPAAGPTAGGGTVTITGTGFARELHRGLRLDRGHISPCPIPGSLTATIPAGQRHVHVTVATDGGTSSTSSADQYTYDPTPTVTGVSPAGGPPAGGTTVTITGTELRLRRDGRLRLESPPPAVSVQSATHLTATVPSASPGTVDVTVTTPGGTSPTSPADEYGYDRPTVSTVSPAAGPIAGGNTVTITGTNFVSGATVALRVQRRHLGERPVGHAADRDRPVRQPRHRRRDGHHHGRDEPNLLRRPLHLRRDANRHRGEPQRRPGRRRQHSHDHRHQLRLRGDGQVRFEGRHIGERPVSHDADRGRPGRAAAARST